ncbi:MAG: hypothetical protein ACP5H2_08835 [Solirubrobacteraceae bacterium]
MGVRTARLFGLAAACALLAATASMLAPSASLAGGVKPCFAEVPPAPGNPQWGFHTGAPISSRNGSYARAEGDVNLRAGTISGTICQVNVSGGVQHLIVLKPTRVLSHSHTGDLYGHLGNLMVVAVRVSSTTDRQCRTGVVGKMTVETTYNGVHESTVAFSFPAVCQRHRHVYHGPQVVALVPES